MKQIFAFLFFFLCPTFVLAFDDACTKPGEYTIDKRCYVTETQKKERPYNAVVGLLDKEEEVDCTGTIVKDQDGRLYVYTARHCVEESFLSENTVQLQKVVLQDGTQMLVEKNVVGDSDTICSSRIKDKETDCDWAVYSVPEGYDNIAFVNSADINQNYGDAGANVVGYGALKIMSDKEIYDFRERYIDFLIQLYELNIMKGSEVYQKEVVYQPFNFKDPLGFDVQDFLKTIEVSCYNELFKNRTLKRSSCKYTSDNVMIGCQAWGGNSGGPIFDNFGNIKGVLTGGNYNIGLKDHAGAKHSESISGIQAEMNKN